MLDKIKSLLGANFTTGDDNIINDLIEIYKTIASDITRRNKTDTKLQPYIIEAVREDYLRRGDEGKKSSSEGSISSNYSDIVEKLRNDLIKNGVRKVL